MSLVEESSEMGVFRHLFNEVFLNPQVQIYISYEGHLFFEMFRIESKFRKLKKKKKNQKLFFVSEIILSENVSINCL